MTTPPVNLTWGEGFGHAVTKAGGMPGIANRLREIWGPAADSRSTLDKLRTFPGPDAMDEAERWRAYQVLVVIGENPEMWGIARGELGVPPGMVAYFHGSIDGPTGATTSQSVTSVPAPRPNRRGKPTNRRNTAYCSLRSGAEDGMAPVAA